VLRGASGHVASPHLVHGTWYDKIGTPETPATESMPPSQPGLHLLQAHRDSFKHFLQDLFPFELGKLARRVQLSEDSTVFISKHEAELRGIAVAGRSQTASELVGVRLSNLLPTTLHGQRFASQLLADRVYFLQSSGSADVAEMRGETYLATAFVPMQVTDCETGLVFTVQVKIGSFPMLTEYANLVISGNPYVIAHRLERSSGAFFSIDTTTQGESVHMIELVTEEYSRIRCRCMLAPKEEDKLSLEVLMPKSNVPLPACLVLLALGVKPEEIKGARNAASIWTEEHDLLERNPDHDACWLAADELCFILGLDTDNYFEGDPVAAFSFKTSWSFASRVGPLGRRRLNERLGLDVSEQHLTPKDFLATFDLLAGSFLGKDSLQVDDIDSLVNKRLRSVGQKMQSLVRDWLSQMSEAAECLPIKIDAVQGTGAVCTEQKQVRELDKFCVAQLWKESNRQLFESVNPLSEVVQARRITQVSELGLDKIKRIQGIRLIHPSHYGRICPIETGEGMSAGIVMAMASNTRVTPDGEMEAPHQVVSQGVQHLSQPWEYLLAQDQFSHRVAQFDVAHAADGTLLAPQRPERGGQRASATATPDTLKRPESVTMTHLGLFGSCSPAQVEYVACGAPISVAVGLIPFVEHDDANRALMGAKHQQQAVPTLWPERPVVGSGMEAQVATYSARTTFAGIDGHVLYCDAAKVVTVSCTGIGQISEEVQNMRQSLRAQYLEGEQLSQWIRFDDFCELCTRLPYAQLQQLYNDVIVSVPNNDQKIKQRLHDWSVRAGINPSRFSFILSEGVQEEAPLPAGWVETEYCIHTQMMHHLITDCASTKKHTLAHDTVAVRANDAVCSGDIIAEGQGIAGGELALGKNLVVAYMPYEGYNYEDAIVISERCVREDILTSVHIEELTLELDEDHVLRNPGGDYDYMSNGMAREGAWLRGGDVAICAHVNNANNVDTGEPPDMNELPDMGEVPDMGELPDTGEPPEMGELPDTGEPPDMGGLSDRGEPPEMPKRRMICVPDDVQGRVIDSSVWHTETVKFGKVTKVQVAKVMLAVFCRIQVGDKLSGRHGNKGIVSKIVPVQDMPYLPDGTPVDVCLNPLGVPSRMNVGQIFENILGSAGRWNGEEYRVGSFDEMFAEEASRGLVFEAMRRAQLGSGNKWLLDAASPGKTRVYDGRTGRPLDTPVTAGISYIIKLCHMVRDKIHARPSLHSRHAQRRYHVITQQPIKGRSRGGGLRLGEMEVSALIGHGAGATLQELLTVKSDDLQGRQEIFQSLSQGNDIVLPKGATSEGYLAFSRELAASGLVLSEGAWSDDELL